MNEWTASKARDHAKVVNCIADGQVMSARVQRFSIFGEELEYPALNGSGSFCTHTTWEAIAEALNGQRSISLGRCMI